MNEQRTNNDGQEFGDSPKAPRGLSRNQKRAAGLAVTLVVGGGAAAGIVNSGSEVPPLSGGPEVVAAKPMNAENRKIQGDELRRQIEALRDYGTPIDNDNPRLVEARDSVKTYTRVEFAPDGGTRFESALTDRADAKMAFAKEMAGFGLLDADDSKTLQGSGAVNIQFAIGVPINEGTPESDAARKGKVNFENVVVVERELLDGATEGMDENLVFPNGGVLRFSDDQSDGVDYLNLKDKTGAELTLVFGAKYVEGSVTTG